MSLRRRTVDRCRLQPLAAPTDVYSTAPHPSPSFLGGDCIAASQIAHLGGTSRYLSWVGGNSSRLHRSSGDLTATTIWVSTPPSAASTAIWGGLFPNPCQYFSLQEWLTKADASLSLSPSAGLHRAPPPEVTFPELELPKTWIEDEEVGLDGVMLVGSGEAGAGVGSGGDMEMEEEDDEVDAEGSTEDELETVPDLEEVVVNSGQKQEVVDNPPEVLERHPQPGPEARSSGHVEQAAPFVAPEKKGAIASASKLYRRHSRERHRGNVP